MSEKKSFKDTLNLPTTEFSIRADAKTKESELLKRWNEEDLDKKTFEHNKGKEKYIFHDGPPYANGHIHMGTAFNKSLKDIICKSRRMMGYHVPFTPGYDCHGLPIEIKVVEKLGLDKDKSKLDPVALKKACRAFAQEWIDVQTTEFKNLGVLGDWDNPYKTMNPTYQASIIRAFAKFVDGGYIERKGKTIPWCAHCQTALATAEIEYQERKDPSTYIYFPLAEEDKKQLLPDVGCDVGFLVWTTTPWTIPLNRAVVLNPTADYVVIKGKDDRALIVGKELADSICKLLEIEKEVLATIPSIKLDGAKAIHPFIEGQKTPILLNEIVTLEDGTACMHMAPGCGPEDYLIGLKHNIEIFSPLTNDGKYDTGILPKELEGMPVVDGQIWVIKTLAANGNLIYKSSLRHSYPHCWRCHNGLMFRATPQWFCNLRQNDLVKYTLEKIPTIQFIPEQGQARLNATISNRTEWCISRQRHWGVPIVALHCIKCEKPHLDSAIILRVAEGVEKEGIEYWDSLDEQTLGVKCSCGSSEFRKETDILDVWFDSGVSHFAVLSKRPELGLPADIYLEGSDQHRGWFQSSLLTSMVLNKKEPMKAIVTHGYVVDEKGRKMSKSLGNVIAPSEMVDKYSRDILRLWAASTNYENDMVISDTVMKNASEVYRKIRNTSRFLLSNLYDFDITKDAVSVESMLSIDQYALARLQEVANDIKEAYKCYDTPAVFHSLGNYCTVDLSSFYLDIIKDRLYVEKADGIIRRSAQTVCYHILDSLTRLMAPVLSFLAEELYDNFKKEGAGSIHLERFAKLTDVWGMLSDIELGKTSLKLKAYGPSVNSSSASLFIKRVGQWETLKVLRSVVLKELENKREAGLIKHSLEAKVTLHLEEASDEFALIHDLINTLKEPETLERFFQDLFIVSQVNFSKEQLNKTELGWVSINVEHADGVKCPRCWQWDVTEHADELCRRCATVLEQ